MNIIEKIKSRRVKCGVIGLGYVGLPLAVEFAEGGATVVGIDVDARKVQSVKRGVSYIQDVATATVRELVAKKKLSATMDFSIIRKLDTVNICVPTPLRKTKDPDVSYIVSAVREIGKYLRRGQLIILESTTYPGTTEEIVQAILEEMTGLRAGRDFHLAFSPERVDPGNPRFNTRNTPKVVGGLTPACTNAAAALYLLAVDNVVRVSSPSAAEMVKLLENTFRSVNIGMANEMALLCDRFKLNVWEIIDAAATKPFGFMPFYPGPGLGGHCIPIDPFYLSWKAKTLDFNAQYIELAGEINSKMPEYVVAKGAAALNDRRLSVKGSKVLVLGVAYKRNIDDQRESPALEIIHLLRQRGAQVTYNDPYVPAAAGMKSRRLTPALLRAQDCVVIATDHTDYDYPRVVAAAKLVVDTRNATKQIKRGRGKIVLI